MINSKLNNQTKVGSLESVRSLKILRLGNSNGSFSVVVPIYEILKIGSIS